MKKFLTVLFFSIFFSITVFPQTSPSYSKAKQNLTSHIFCPDEIKEFMAFYPDIEYFALYDLEVEDWKIEMTADLYFNRTAKPKEKKTATFIGLADGFCQKSCFQKRKITGFFNINTTIPFATQRLTLMKKSHKSGISHHRKTARIQAAHRCFSLIFCIRHNLSESLKST